jgi:uroporphyrinogen-III synthase/uroporphyrinogen III methyltransferase/synthase
MSQPLVVVTRDEGPLGPLSRRLAALGASVWPLPCTATAAAADLGPLDAALAALASFDWLVFTSARAVQAVVDRPGWPAEWPDPPGRPRIAAVGSATAARVRAARVPVHRAGDSGGAVLTGAIAETGASLQGARVLWPRADRARPDLARALAAAGAHVTDPVAYRTLLARPDSAAGFVEALEAGRIAAVTFASPSAAQGLAALLPGEALERLRGRTLVASIGPSTSAALAALGAPADVESRRPGAGALADAVVARLGIPTGGP